MGIIIARFLIRSQNYNLSTKNSDIDYKIIEMPTYEDLFKGKKLTRQSGEHCSIMDYRQFCNLYLKANPNILETLWSVEQNYWDDNFKKLIEMMRFAAPSIIRTQQSLFHKAVKGLALDSYERKKDIKGLVRAMYFSEFLARVREANGEINENTWREQGREEPLRQLLENQTLEAEKQNVLYFSTMDKISMPFSLTEQSYDNKIVEEINQLFQNYFSSFLTEK